MGMKPAAMRSGEGEARWWMGSLAVIKATAADTGGGLTIVEITEPPNAEAPLHVHHREDEAFWILEGSATFEVGDETFAVGPGDYAFGPRGTPHRYTIGPEGCRMLFVFTPGGFEELLRATSEPAAELTLPPPSDEEPDFEELMATVQRYGAEILG
jgi:quercetin dioxygenase-like cupin family protein